MSRRWRGPSIAQPKQILEIYRLLCGDKKSVYELCNLFDQETQNGSDMILYSRLLRGGRLDRSHVQRALSAYSLGEAFCRSAKTGAFDS